MSRVSNWRVKEIVNETVKDGMVRLNMAAHLVANRARQKCPVGTKAREGQMQHTAISFTPQTGRRKGRPVSFIAQVTQKRVPGTLKKTIRVVDRPGKGNVRVIAGNSEVIYARFVERGTSKMAAKPFLRPALNESKAEIRAILKVDTVG